MSIKQQLMKRIAAVNIDQLSDEEFVDYVVKTLGPQECALILEDFYWDGPFTQMPIGDLDDAFLKPFGMRMKRDEEYTEEEIDAGANEAGELFDLTTNEYVGYVHCQDRNSFIDALVERATVKSVTECIRVCMDIDKNLIEGLFEKAIVEKFQPSTAVASNKQKTTRTADIATDQLSDEEFIKYVINTLGLEECVCILNEFYWEGMVGAGYPAGEETDEFFKPFGLREKHPEEYTKEEWAVQENGELFDIDTKEFVCDFDCTDDADLVNTLISRATIDSVTGCMSVAMNINKDFFEAIAMDTIVEKFQPSTTMASKAGK